MLGARFFVGLWPESLDAEGVANPEFYEKGNVACYPPEADFLVQSRLHPDQVSDYAEFVRRRDTYDTTQARFSAFRRWPASVTA